MLEDNVVEQLDRIEVTFYDKHEDGQVTCRICEFRCRIKPGEVGRCKVRKNEEGFLRALNYAHLSNASLGPVDLHSVYHMYPGANSFAVGSYGCNFYSEAFPTGHLTACAEVEKASARLVSAEKTVGVAKQRLCRGVVFAFSEPLMWYEYLLSTIKQAKASGQFTLALANGFWTQEALDLAGPYLDGMRLSLPALDKEMFKTITGTEEVSLVLAAAIRAQQQHFVHLEVATYLSSGLNDDLWRGAAIANWIVKNLGPATPWHINNEVVLPGNPERSPTPVGVIKEWIAAGKAAGLSFVYSDDPAIEGGRDTVCPGCHQVVIARVGENVQLVALEEGRCAKCGVDLNIRSTVFKAELRAKRRQKENSAGL